MNLHASGADNSSPLSQTQIIRSLGQALEWFEKELYWGVAPGQLNHLTGRIGELYAAMVTRGQMARATNQRGYDVVSADGDRISVKTVTSATQALFNANTFDIVNRVMILQIVVEEGEVSIEELYDEPASKFLGTFPVNSQGKYAVSISNLKSKSNIEIGSGSKTVLSLEEQRRLEKTGEARYGDFRIVQYENGTVLVDKNGENQAPALPILKEIARKVSVPVVTSTGTPKNTRYLGSGIISALS